MLTFRVVITGDFLNEKEESAYGPSALDSLESVPFIEHAYIRDQIPQAGDSSYWGRLYSMEVRSNHIRGAHGLVVLRPHVKRDAFALGSGDLTVIGRSGAGYDKIDLAACTENDVALFNAPGALNHSTAAAALLLMLALAKRLKDQERITREGRWDLQASVLGGELRGRTLGIVGLGHSGRELARLVAPFEMKLIAHSPHADPAQADALGVTLTSLDHVFKQSDFLSLHCRLTKDTHKLIDERLLSLMKPSAYFVNVARGEIVDEVALDRVLRDRRIAGAGIDVFAEEPPPRDHPFFTLDNVILTPHWLASSQDVWAATSLAMVEGMKRAAVGEIPENVVNPEVLRSPRFLEKLKRFRANR